MSDTHLCVLSEKRRCHGPTETHRASTRHPGTRAVTTTTASLHPTPRHWVLTSAPRDRSTTVHHRSLVQLFLPNTPPTRHRFDYVTKASIAKA
ncbi:hypothetical protein E2C01_068947 [Portunus trituberculatus]|uniref:Uncharacterized protein n=1 Tax=Portunus trituberculatus TaxID=210409 RepID=A0A5B7HXB2_PORTR|nr:hypothetical protein [Portunus trituberculatus]